MSLTDLTFFTTNQTKLAHSRYLGRPRGYRILGFRERTYYASYNEPRILNREKLLRASFESALDQADRANVLRDDTIFFLEDTSVKIEILSGDGEYPGTEVKYWMRDTTFPELDEALRQSGNDRSCHVRSDVVMRLPASLRKSLGLREPYVIFTGIQQGSITETEQQFNTHLFYPWLDNKTFNKWFVPSGEKDVLGSLPIKKANLYDFRAKAMNKMFDFLGKTDFAPTSGETQASLPLESIVSLSGYTCAGKTTGAQYMQKEHGFLHVEASDFMHLAFAERHGESEGIKIGDFAEIALNHEPNVVARQVVEYLESLDWPKKVIISGFRDPEEVDYLTNHKSGRLSNLNSVFILASEEDRFKRMKGRMRPGDTISESEFKRRDAQQARMGLENICEKSECIRNEGNLAHYYEIIASKVAFGMQKLPKVDELSYQDVRELELEACILLTLESLPQEDETGEFYTTTEISNLVKEVFPNLIKAKNKNNISRYFNQYNRPFFDRRISEDSKKKSYRLSNTGYGYAQRIIFELRQVNKI